MKINTLTRSVQIGLVALAVSTLSIQSRAEDVIRYKGRPVGTKVRIDGAANVHKWNMEGTIISGYFEVPASVDLTSAKGEIASKAEISIPVSSIKNTEWEGMSEVMLDAMHATNSPYIKFNLTSLNITTPGSAGKALVGDVKGNLIINNITNATAFPVSIETIEKGRLKITATDVPVKMTDFKIAPPVKLGIFTTDPDVKISFEWMVGVPKGAVAK